MVVERTTKTDSVGFGLTTDKDRPTHYHHHRCTSPAGHAVECIIGYFLMDVDFTMDEL